MLTLRAATAAALLLGVVPGAPATAADGAWVPTLVATSGFDNLSAFPDGTAYSAAGLVTFNDGRVLPDPLPPVRGDSAGFFKSTDFGQTWQPVAPPPARTTGTSNLWLRFATPQVGYATASYGTFIPKDPTGKVDRVLCRQMTPMFRTTDGGRSWQPLCDPHLPSGEPITHGPSPLGVAPDGRTVFVTATEYDGETDHGCPVARGAVWTSSDAGESWRRSYLPRYWDPGWSVRAYDGRTALVVAYKYTYDSGCTGLGQQNAVFLTNDAGRTWRKVYDCKGHPVCTAAAFVTRSHLVVGRSDGTTASSVDGGRTWRAGQRLYDRANAEAERADPERRYWHWVQSFDFTGRVGYASTRGAGTWRTTNGGKTWTQERSHECVYYPWGVGENAVATADRAITGGPAFISARVPSAAPAGPCTPDPGQRAAATPAVVAQAGPYAVLPDGALRR